MYCPHCHNEIPDGSNICPLCYANLTGYRPQSAKEETRNESGAQPRKNKNAHNKSSKNHRKRNTDRMPMFIAFGLILILIIIIAMIVKSMFSAGEQQRLNTPEPPPLDNFVVFGDTPTPNPLQETLTPNIEVTPTPAPTAEVTYTTLRKNDRGREVVTLQQALSNLGYLNSQADGIFGTATETAVRNFQQANNLSVDGIAGKQTLELLYNLAQMTPIPETTVGPGDIMDLPG